MVIFHSDGKGIKNHMKQIRINKYHNKKYTAPDGQTYDSKHEFARHQELLLLQKAGKIEKLERQVKYLLIPSQYGTENGKRKCIEYPCHYIADFVYLEDGKLVVEDAKGFKTKEYIIKRKLMLKKYGIKIKEV